MKIILIMKLFINVKMSLLINNTHKTLMLAVKSI